MQFVRNHIAGLTWLAYMVVAGALVFFLPRSFLLSRLGFVLWLAFPLLLAIGWGAMRLAAKERAKQTRQLDARIPRRFSQAWREWLELLIFADDKKRRIASWVLLGVGVVLSAIFPYGVIDGQFVLNPGAPMIAGAFGGFLVWIAYVAPRCHSVFVERQESLELIFNMARTPLKYPRKVRPTRDEIPFQRPETCIRVEQWESITDPRVFSVLAPPTLDMGDLGPWNIFHTNVEKRMPLDTGWHREEIPPGRGYRFMPASYPTGVLWEGEVAPDPLDFFIGADLDAPGETVLLTFSDSSPHAIVVGGTGSGKLIPGDTPIVRVRNGQAEKVTVADLEIGDLLLDSEGNTAPIRAFSEWEDAQVYRVHYSDGTYDEASGDHLWTTWDRPARLSESRAQRSPGKQWLPDEVIERLEALASEAGPADYISLSEVARLIGKNSVSSPIRALAEKIGESHTISMTYMREGKPVTRMVIGYPVRDMLYGVAELGRRHPKDQSHLRSLPAIRTTLDIRDSLMVGTTHLNHSIPAPAPLNFPERDLPCDPYIVGAWIGDGITSAMVRNKSYWAYLNDDRFILDEVVRLSKGAISLGEPVPARNHLGDESVVPSKVSSEVPIFGLRSHLPTTVVLSDPEWSSVGLRKTLPEDYLLGSIDQRLALLQGLMDTDGTVTKHGSCEFSQSDEALALQVRTLIESLGMVASMRAKDPHYTTPQGGYGEGRTNYTIAFTPPEGLDVFRLPRKRALFNAYRASTTRRAFVSTHRYITAVEATGETKPMRCIAIDSHTHQYVIGDHFHATHNTSTAEAIMAQAGVKPMPWGNDSDPIFGQSYIIDPKGAFANRWEGRPNMHVINGSVDYVSDDGDEISGIEKMRDKVAEVHTIMGERQKLLDAYKEYDAANWLELPDEVKRDHRLAPIFLVMDEYLDWMDLDSSGSEQSERDNQAKRMVQDYVKLIVRKGRSLGVHLILIAQEANMSLIGSNLMRNAPVHVMMGNMDPSIYKTFFGATEDRVPPLPADRPVKTKTGHTKRKPIPGRGRVQAMSGSELVRIQALWFGGEKNSKTLDQFLPKDPSYHASRGEPSPSLDVQELFPAAQNAVMETPEVQAPQRGIMEVVEASLEEEREGEKEKEKKGKRKNEEEDRGPHKEEEKTETEEGKKPEPPEHPCYHEGCMEPTRACANPRCPAGNYVCAKHAKFPDGTTPCCPTCYESHMLTRAGLAPLMPWIARQARQHGARVTFAHEGSGAIVHLNTLDGVQLVKIRGSADTGVSAVDGTRYARDPQQIKAMITDALKGA